MDLSILEKMFAKGHTSIRLNDIYELVSDEEILDLYFNINKIPCLINSPIRKDNNPSFGLFYGKDNRIYFKDFGNQEKGNIIDMLKKYYSKSYDDVIDMIYSDLKKSRVMPEKKIKRINHEPYYHRNLSPLGGHSSDIKNIKVAIRDWKSYDLEYWDKYGISLKWLKWGDIYPISTIFIYKNQYDKLSEIKIRADKYAYAFVERKDGIETYKIYQPYSEKFKWMSKHDHSVWNGWTRLPNIGEKLIITSSLKDSLCLISNLNIPSISLQSESILPKKHVILQLIKRFNKIYVWYDTDDTGRNFSHKLCNEYNLTHIEIPEKYKTKDPSDYYAKYGKESFIKLAEELLC